MTSRHKRWNVVSENFTPDQESAIIASVTSVEARTQMMIMLLGVTLFIVVLIALK